MVTYGTPSFPFTSQYHPVVGVVEAQGYVLGGHGHLVSVGTAVRRTGVPTGGPTGGCGVGVYVRVKTGDTKPGTSLIICENPLVTRVK